MKKEENRIVVGNVIGQIDASVVPRFAGIGTFARLPRREDINVFDVAFVGVPFDSGIEPYKINILFQVYPTDPELGLVLLQSGKHPGSYDLITDNKTYPLSRKYKL